MSKLANLLKKPRNSRWISFGVILILILTSAYFAYKRGIFADVDNTRCTFKLKRAEYDNVNGLPMTRSQVVVLLNGSQVGSSPNSSNSSFLGPNAQSITINPGQKLFFQAYTGNGKLVLTTDVWDTHGRVGDLEVGTNAGTKYFTCRGGDVFDVAYNIKNEGPNYINVVRIAYAGMTQQGASGQPVANQSGGTTSGAICAKDNQAPSETYVTIDRSVIQSSPGRYTEVSPVFCQPPPAAASSVVQPQTGVAGSTQSGLVCARDIGASERYIWVERSMLGADYVEESDSSKCGSQPTQASQVTTTQTNLVCARDITGATTSYTWIDRSFLGADYVEEPDTSKCGTQPTSGQSTTQAGSASSIWQCNQFDTAGQEFDWVYKNKEGKYKTANGADPANIKIVADSNCKSAKPTTTPQDAAVGPEQAAAQPGDVLIPTLGNPYPDSTGPTGTVKFSAYRFSENGEGPEGKTYVPVGGVKLNVNGREAGQSPQADSAGGSTPTPDSTGFANIQSCGTLEAVNNIPLLNRLLGRQLGNMQVITPDNGMNNSVTNILKLPAGYYRVNAASKNGLGLATPTRSFLGSNGVCFQVAPNQTKEVRVLLDATSEAEPPGISAEQVLYDRDIKGRNRYTTTTSGGQYLYYPEAPYYGWQKVTGDASTEFGYNFTPPRGFDENGNMIPGFPSTYGIPYGGISELSRICQGYTLSIGGQLDGTTGAILGAILGSYRNGEFEFDAKRTLIGGVIGAIIGNNMGDNAEWRIDMGQLQRDCQALQNFNNNFYPGYGQNLFNQGLFQLPGAFR